MAANLLFSFEQDERILTIGFAPGSELQTSADIERFAGEITERCERAGCRVHFFFDLAGLTVHTEAVELFSSRKQALCERFALSTWHFGGNLAERVMTRNELTRRGLRPNLFRSRQEALAAFRRDHDRQAGELRG